MKKTMLCGALLTLICAQVQAEVTQQPTQSQTPGSSTTPAANAQPTQVPVVNQGIQNTQPVQNTQTPQTQTTNQQPAQNTQPTQPAQQATTVQPQPTTVQPKPAPVINCEYKIPTQTKTIEQSIVITWAEKATTQAFDFDPANVDNQVQKLKPCFTEQGWSGFNSALEKSGNVEAIKTQKLTVSSQVDGQTQVTEAKDNQWKITLPLHVVYQNDKEKVTQLLSINLTVGRKASGDLGIVQMIATPRTAAASQPSTTPAATDTNNTAQPTGATNTPNTATPANTVTPAAEQQPTSGSTTTTNPGTPH